MRNLMNSTYLCPSPKMAPVRDTTAYELRERYRIADFAYEIRKFKAEMVVDAIKNSARPDMAVGLLAAFVGLGRYEPDAPDQGPEGLGWLLRDKYQLLNGSETERDAALRGYVMELLA